jgi:hypothetical protein
MQELFQQAVAEITTCRPFQVAVATQSKLRSGWPPSQKGLAFHSKRSMCVVIARAVLPGTAPVAPTCSTVRGSSQ